MRFAPARGLSMPCSEAVLVVRALGARLLLRRTGACLVKNVDLLVAYLGSSVELARDLGCFEHLITMFYDMVSSVLREC